MHASGFRTLDIKLSRSPDVAAYAKSLRIGTCAYWKSLRNGAGGDGTKPMKAIRFMQKCLLRLRNVSRLTLCMLP